MKAWIKKHWLISTLIFGMIIGPPISYGLVYLLNHKDRLVDRQSETVLNDLKKSGDEFWKICEGFSVEADRLNREIAESDLNDEETFKYKEKIAKLFEIGGLIDPIKDKLIEADGLIRTGLRTDDVKHFEEAKKTLSEANEMMKTVKQKLREYKKSAV